MCLSVLVCARDSETAWLGVVNESYLLNCEFWYCVLKYAQMAGRANVVDAAFPTAHKAPFRKKQQMLRFSK